MTSANDGDPLELGVKFRSDVAGYITGIRFYKGAGNTGTHVGHLWTLAGTLLATATFTSETATGWQQVNFATPVAIAANTTYVASYYAPTAAFAATRVTSRRSGADNAPLHALANGVERWRRLVRLGPVGTFPTSVVQSTNYWVDVVFSNTNSADIGPRR